MIETYRTVRASELCATEIGVTGAPLPSNGPGRKSPFLKYLIVGGIVIGTVVLAYHLHKKSLPKLIPRKNEDRTAENEKVD
jgi:hypothetical protein